MSRQVAASRLHTAGSVMGKQGRTWCILSAGAKAGKVCFPLVGSPVSVCIGYLRVAVSAENICSRGTSQTCMS